jgi:hypothetical protein
MARTFKDCMDEVQAVGPFDTTARSTGRIGLWVNDASDWWIGSRLWAWRETTTTVASVSGSGSYVLTGTSPIVTDFAGVLIDVTHSIANATPNNAPKLRFWQQQDFDDVFSVTGATAGPPLFYTLRGGAPKTTSATIVPGGEQQLSVWPVPNYIGQFALRYFRNVDSCRMTADTDVSLIPQQHLSAIIAKAAGWGLITKGAVLQGQSLVSAAEEMLQAAIALDEQARTGDRPAGERPMFPQQVQPNPANTAPRMTPYGYDA